MTIDQLINEEGFDAVFIGSGAGLPRFMGIPGEKMLMKYSQLMNTLQEAIL